MLAKNPNHTGSLGVAISEAVELAVQRDDTKYALGSVLNHVLLHQTVIGQEAMEQMKMADTWPDVVIGCAGGGSNFAGIAFPLSGTLCAADKSRALWRWNPPPARHSRVANTPMTLVIPPA